jgi:hypothetical protein
VFNGGRERRVLDRSALGDLWRNTLEQIPTKYGKLVYLASLRDPNTGRYRHHGFTAVFGRAESNTALAASHLEVFRDWLSAPLDEKFADLDRYLASLERRREKIARNWRRTRAYRNSVPAAALEAERVLFYAEMEALLAILKNPTGVSTPRADSSQPR